VLVLFLEKTVIQPKIIGDRVGMHPVAVIISVLMGTTLVGGVIGGLLAIPVAMALRAVLFRYVWVKRELPDKAVQMEVL
jgi:predicted PurR-regulated permease PerM